MVFIFCLDSLLTSTLAVDSFLDMRTAGVSPQLVHRTEPLRFGDESTEWRTVQIQPGYFGLNKKKRIAEYDRTHGKENWRIAWQYNNKTITFEEAAVLYEEAYYQHLLKNPYIVDYLVKNAADVYDYSPTNTKCGTSYDQSTSSFNHLQDIAIRRVIILRLGLRFQGSRLIQIRGRSEDPIGRSLQPGNIPFHAPELIYQPHLAGWWDAGSVEDFYQSNKVLQVKC